MDDNELLNSWRKPIEVSIISVWKAFAKDPKLILTESDLKCWLFRELLGQTKKTYTVHSEVTHYHKHDKKNRKIHFRDISLLDPDNLALNKELWDIKRPGLNKGFLHRGVAIHFELKLVRQSLNSEGKMSVSTKDIEHLLKYKPDGRQRRFVIIWGSKNEGDLKILEDAFREAFKKFNNEHLIGDKIDAYLFDPQKLIHLTWTKQKWALK